MHAKNGNMDIIEEPVPIYHFAPIGRFYLRKKKTAANVPDRAVRAVEISQLFKGRQIFTIFGRGHEMEQCRFWDANG